VSRCSCTSRSSPRTRFFHPEVVRDLDEFKRRSDVIVADRRTPDITHVADKVYTCDLFGSD